MANKQPAKKKQRPAMGAPTNGWDVIVVFISKGLPIPSLAGCIILSAIWKMPQNDVKQFVLEALGFFKGGWINKFLIAALITAVIFSRIQVKTKRHEICRIAKERDKWQQIAGCTIESSDREEQ